MTLELSFFVCDCPCWFHAHSCMDTLGRLIVRLGFHLDELHFTKPAHTKVYDFSDAAAGSDISHYTIDFNLLHTQFPSVYSILRDIHLHLHLYPPSPKRDTSYSSSQVDPLGISYCSQTSRDSALESSQSEKPEVVGKISSVSDYLRTVIKSQNTPGTYTFGKGVIRNPKFDSPTEETGSALVRKTPKFSIKFWNRPNFDSTAKMLHTENCNRSKPNVRWNYQSTRTKINQVNNCESGTVKRPVEPPNSQEDIFLDLSKNGGDDQEDGFTSSSDDCISLSALLEE
ncbi:unnamed protein product [Hymenolepis diminuta]|uniref:Uncharacterized protein n=1 Tax=Hymenolepis diminuta TaxID=6216 RepID=A0A3P6WI67_HYMDI|nr:unnamed protein product [Hymenolepis diminuta]